MNFARHLGAALFISAALLAALVMLGALYVAQACERASAALAKGAL